MHLIGNSLEKAASELEEGGVIPDWLQQGVRGTVRSMVPQAAAAYVAPTSKLAQLTSAISTASSIEMSGAATEGKKAELSGYDLAKYVASEGAIEALPAAIFSAAGMHGAEGAFLRAANPGKAAKFFAEGVKRGLAKMGLELGSELVEENITEIGHALNTAAQGVDETADDDLWGVVAQTSIQTTIQMLASGGVSSAIRSKARGERKLRGERLRESRKATQARGGKVADINPMAIVDISKPEALAKLADHDGEVSRAKWAEYGMPSLRLNAEQRAKVVEAARQKNLGPDAEARARTESLLAASPELAAVWHSKSDAGKAIDRALWFHANDMSDAPMSRPMLAAGELGIDGLVPAIAAIREVASVEGRIDQVSIDKSIDEIASAYGFSPEQAKIAKVLANDNSVKSIHQGAVPVVAAGKLAKLAKDNNLNAGAVIEVAAYLEKINQGDHGKLQAALRSKIPAQGRTLPALAQLESIAFNTKDDVLQLGAVDSKHKLGKHVVDRISTLVKGTKDRWRIANVFDGDENGFQFYQKLTKALGEDAAKRAVFDAGYGVVLFSKPDGTNEKITIDRIGRTFVPEVGEAPAPAAAAPGPAEISGKQTYKDFVAAAEEKKRRMVEDQADAHTQSSEEAAEQATEYPDMDPVYDLIESEVDEDIANVSPPDSLPLSVDDKIPEKRRVTQAEILAVIKDLFGAPVFERQSMDTGKYSPTAIGLHFPEGWSGAGRMIWLKKQFWRDVGTIAHEVAHWIDDNVDASTYFFSTQADRFSAGSREELIRLDYNFDKDNPGNGYLKQEGWSEFIRLLMTYGADKPLSSGMITKLQTVYPNLPDVGATLPQAAPEMWRFFTTRVKEQAPDIYKKIERTRAIAEAWSDQGASKRAASKIRPNTPFGQDVDPYATKSERVMRNLTAGWSWVKGEFIRARMLREMEMEGRLKSPKYYDMQNSAFEMFRTLDKAANHAQRAAIDGVHWIGQDQLGTHQNLGGLVGSESLRKVHEFFNDDQEYVEHGQAYFVARIALNVYDMYAEKNNITPEEAADRFQTLQERNDALAVIQKYEDSGDAARYQEAYDMLAQFNDNLVLLVTRSGVMTMEEARRIIDDYKGRYLPQFKPGRFGPVIFGKKGMLGIENPLRSRSWREGDQLDIIDPIHATYMKTQVFYEAVLRRRFVVHLLQETRAMETPDAVRHYAKDPSMTLATGSVVYYDETTKKATNDSDGGRNEKIGTVNYVNPMDPSKVEVRIKIEAPKGFGEFAHKLPGMEFDRTDVPVMDILAQLVQEGIVSEDLAKMIKLKHRELKRDTEPGDAYPGQAPRWSREDVRFALDWLEMDPMPAEFEMSEVPFKEMLQKIQDEVPNPEAVLAMYRPMYRNSPRDSVFVVMRDQYSGKMERYYIHPGIYDLMTKAPIKIQGALKLVSFLTRSLKTTAVKYSPSFIIWNPWRDYNAFLAQSQWSQETNPIPIALEIARWCGWSSLDTLGVNNKLGKTLRGLGFKDFADFFDSNQFYETIKQHGGDIANRLNYYDAGKLRKGIAPWRWRSRYGRLAAGVHATLHGLAVGRDAYAAISAGTDMGPRIKEGIAYLKHRGYTVTESGKIINNSTGEVARPSEAELTSMIRYMNEATTDFAEGGLHAKNIDQFVPFFAASINGTHAMARTVAKASNVGGRYTKREVDAARRSLAVYSSVSAVAAAIYWAFRHDDDDWAEKPDWMKLTYWTVPRDETGRWRMPKGYDWSFIPNFVQATLDEFFGDDPGALVAMIKHTLVGQDPTDVFSVNKAGDIEMNFPNISGARTMMEIRGNRSYFSDAPIVKASEMKYAAHLRGSKRSTVAANALAWMLQGTGATPAGIDYFADSFTAGYWTTLNGKDNNTVGKLTGAKATYISELPKSVTDFWVKRDDDAQDWNRAKQLGDKDWAEKYGQAQINEHVARLFRALGTYQRESLDTTEEKRAIDRHITSIARDHLGLDPLDRYGDFWKDNLDDPFLRKLRLDFRKARIKARGAMPPGRKYSDDTESWADTLARHRARRKAAAKWLQDH
jgi:hypothetical protein